MRIKKRRYFTPFFVRAQKAAMNTKISPTATKSLISALNSEHTSIEGIRGFFSKGADPWAYSNMGSSVLDLCLRDGRHRVASAWAQSAREHLKKIHAFKNPLADLRVIDLVACSVYLNPKDRQDNLRKFLFKPEKIDEHHAFICKMFNSRNPQIWSVIANMLLLQPHLNALQVPMFVNNTDQNDFFFEDSDIVYFFNQSSSHGKNILIDEFVSHAPNQVLYNYVKDGRHVVNLDWTTNPAIRDRLRSMLSSHWAHQWREVSGFYKGLSGVNQNGESALHHYLQSTPPAQISVEGLDVLINIGNSWDHLDKTGVTPLTLIKVLLETEQLSKNVKFFTEQTALPAQSTFRPLI